MDKMTTPLGYGMAIALCAALLIATPAAATPAPGTVWTDYVGELIEKAPLALQRGYCIINQLELQGCDVAPLQETYAAAKTHYGQALVAFQAGQVSVAENPIFVCKSDLAHLAGQIQELSGTGIYAKGMARALTYCFPSYAEFAAGL
jgi:hypothetical protein